MHCCAAFSTSMQLSVAVVSKVTVYGYQSEGLSSGCRSLQPPTCVLPGSAVLHDWSILSQLKLLLLLQRL